MNAAPTDAPEPRVDSTPRWLRLAPLLLVALAVLLRLFQLVELPSFPSFYRPEVDAFYYQEFARRIAAGDWLLAGTPPRMSPGYTYFLGLIYLLLGDGPWSAPIVQMLLGLVAVALIGATARRYLDARWSLLALGLAGLYGPFVYFESHLLAASLGVVLVAWLLWLASGLYFAAAASHGRWLAIGAVWGLCCVVRPNALLLFASLVWLAHSVPSPGRRALWSRLAWLALGGALAIAPLTMRNLAVTGELTPLTSHGGINFYIGNGPGAIGTWTVPKDVPGADSPTSQFDAFHRVAEQRLGRSLSGREADGYWYRRTLEAVFADPLRWSRIMLRKLHLFWNGRELHNIYDYEFWRDIGVVLGAPLPQFLWVAPFGLLAMLWLPFGTAAERFLSAFIACLCAGVVMVYVTDRYRLPVVVPTLVATPIVIQRLWQCVRASAARRSGGLSRALVAPLIALVVACGVAVPVKVNKRYHEKYCRLGDAWLGLGRLDYAQWAYQHAVAADPGYLPAREKLAEVLAQGGQLEQARAGWLQVVEVARQRGDDAALARAQAELDALPPNQSPSTDGL